METRIKKYNQLSPERAKVWTEKSPKYQQTRKVPVIYYLCRNRQLEHPHFMEVPLSSPEGLHLRGICKIEMYKNLLPLLLIPPQFPNDLICFKVVFAQM